MFSMMFMLIFTILVEITGPDYKTRLGIMIQVRYLHRLLPRAYEGCKI